MASRKLTLDDLAKQLQTIRINVLQVQNTAPDTITVSVLEDTLDHLTNAISSIRSLQHRQAYKEIIIDTESINGDDYYEMNTLR